MENALTTNIVAEYNENKEQPTQTNRVLDNQVAVIQLKVCKYKMIIPSIEPCNASSEVFPIDIQSLIIMSFVNMKINMDMFLAYFLGN